MLQTKASVCADGVVIKGGDSVVALLFKRVGDSLMATPALRATKAKYPNARLVVICEGQVTRVFKGLSFVDRIIDVGNSSSILKLSSVIRSDSRPAAILDFLSDPRTAVTCALSGAPVRVGFAKPIRRFAYTHKVALQDRSSPLYSSIHKSKLAEALGAQTASVLPEFSLTADDTVSAQRVISSLSGSGTRTAAMFVTSRRAYKRWPLERFAEVAMSVARLNVKIAIVGGPGESHDALILCNLAGVPKENAVTFDNLGSMAAFLARCSLYVGNDGGPKHLAVAVGTPTLTVFQNDPFEYWTPPDNAKHVAIGGVNKVPIADEVSRAACDMLTAR